MGKLSHIARALQRHQIFPRGKRWHIARAIMKISNVGEIPLWIDIAYGKEPKTRNLFP